MNGAPYAAGNAVLKRSPQNPDRKKEPKRGPMEQKSSAIVILGASGDLARRKLIPALLKLCQTGQLCQSTMIVGSGRKPFTDKTFRQVFTIPDQFASRLFYHQGIPGLKKYLTEKGVFFRIVVFFALPPQVYAETARELAAEGFGEETSIIVEKPFGANYVDALSLNRRLTKYFKESNIYRIDHYLAKEPVRNILVFRFANPLFYPVWNNEYIESIQIDACEIKGVESRAEYFDKAGILRDMVQNHLMQLICLMTMEMPKSLAPDDIIKKKIKLLQAITVEECYRHQYEGYQQEKGVDAHSRTETFVEIKLRIDNPQWKGTPVYVRCGKALTRDETRIGVRFRPMKNDIFKNAGKVMPNGILFLIQPFVGIIMEISSKNINVDDPMIKNSIIPFCMDESLIPDAYQKLLLDAINGDHTLFVHAREANLAWKAIDEFLDKGPVKSYEKNSIPNSHFNIGWDNFDDFIGQCRIRLGK
jgi:glucose-6-phosphate 1-dehydrogenase